MYVSQLHYIYIVLHFSPIHISCSLIFVFGLSTLSAARLGHLLNCLTIENVSHLNWTRLDLNLTSDMPRAKTCVLTFPHAQALC